MKIGVSLVLLTLLAFSIGAMAVTTPSCSDGTEAFKCSKSQPGYACLPGSSTYSLQNVQSSDCPLAPKVCDEYRAKCTCPAGYVKDPTQGCVKNTCDDGGKTLQNGECSATKPKQCVSGTLQDNAGACGCPAGQEGDALNSYKTCKPSLGCRWKTISCLSNQDCTFNANDPADGGTCKPKKGCAYGTQTCTSDQTCETATTPDGICVTKPGCKYLNPKCPSGQMCDAVSNTCMAAPSGSSDNSPVVPSTNAPSTSNASAGNLACCCLPAAGAAAMVGLVSFRRRSEDEES